MSRQENYFHPVAELLSNVEKQSIIDNFYLNKETYEIEENSENKKYFDDGVILHQLYLNGKQELKNKTFSEFKKMLGMHKNSEVLFFNPLKEKKAKFYNLTANVNSKMFDLPEIKTIEKLYHGKVACFVYTNGNGITIGKHTDDSRNCCLTIPLSPDYSEYRNCYFYENLEDDKPIHIVNYSKIRSPVLLNNQKIHSVDNKLLSKPTLCVQVIFEPWKKYIDIRKMLSEKGLLTTTI